MLTLEEGAFLVRTARKAFFAYIDQKGSDTPKPPFPRLREKIGAYVRAGIFAEEQGQRDLILGFTGYPIPYRSVYQSVKDASVSIAARSAGTYVPGSKISFEVTILSSPQPLNATRLADLASAIEFGRDAVMITSGSTKAIILPQTALTKCGNEVGLLAECCTAAGLMADAWLTSPKVGLYRFRSQIFREKAPENEVIEVSLPCKHGASATPGRVH